MFNPDEFLNMPIEGSNDTKVIPVPVGDYLAVIDEAKVRQWVGKKDPSQSGVALDIVWIIDSPELKAQLGRDKITVKQGVMLELNDANMLDMSKGKNVGLGRLREAVNLNTPGEPFSFNMLPGRLAKVNVKHRVDGEDIFAEVKSVAKA